MSDRFRPSGKNTVPGADLPEAVVHIQTALEAQFLAAKRQEARVIHLYGRRPSPFWRPSHALRVWRWLVRLPVLGRVVQVYLLSRSGLFDASWYLEQYPDVARARKWPALHYLRFGAAEGRNPGPNFQTEHYQRLHPDLSRRRINPVVDYQLWGWEAHRSIHAEMPDGLP